MAATVGLNLIDPLYLATSPSTRVISASTTKAGAVYIAPKTGNIRYIGTTYSALSGSPTVDIRLETVATRLPTGTLFGTNTNGSRSPGATNTFEWTQLTADAAVTAGDAIAAVVGYTSGTSATCVYSTGGGTFTVGSPRSVVMASGSWAFTGPVPMIAVKYDDGTIIPGGLPAHRVTTNTFQSGTNPNERATVFTAPAGVSLSGVRIMGDFRNGQIEINLYSGTSTSAVSGGTITLTDSDCFEAGQFPNTLTFASPISLTGGQAYRIGVKATAAQNVLICRATFLTTAEREAAFGGATADSRNGGAWIGEQTSETEMIFPIFSAVTAGGGGLIDGGLIS